MDIKEVSNMFWTELYFKIQLVGQIALIILGITSLGFITALLIGGAITDLIRRRK